MSELEHEKIQEWIDVCPYDPIEKRLVEHPLGPGELYRFKIVCSKDQDLPHLNDNFDEIEYEPVRAFPDSQIQFLKMKS